MIETALPREVAFARINGKGNRKPLLVMRECTKCKGTDHAVFDRKLNNEKTLLLAKWFYCVKLPPRVVEMKHPFRKVFTEHKPAHVFLSTWDGKDVVAFDGNQSQTLLQKKMIELIELAYEKKPEPAIKAMLRFLSDFDNHDSMLSDYKDRLQQELLRPKPRKSRIKKLEQRIAMTEKKKAKAMQRAKAVCDLKLKVEKTPAKAEKPEKAEAVGGN